MSWENDKQLLRAKGPHNLSVGEPAFLADIFRSFYPRHFPSDVAYPDNKPLPELEQAIRDGGVKDEDIVVVGNGAKQVLWSVFMSASATSVGAKPPYWPSYPTLTDLSGFPFNPERALMWGDEIEIVTIPNNPNGKMEQQRFFPNNECYVVWDAAYACKAYGFTWDKAPEHDISVWSAGKLLGCPGTRVGWAVFKPRHKEWAERTARLIEQTTSGVSGLNQYFVAATLRNAWQRLDELWSQGNDVLKRNYDICTGLKGIKTIGSYRGHGMFMWVDVKSVTHWELALKRSGVKMVNGKACGGENDQWRIALGQNPEYTRAAVKAFNEAYEAY